MKFNIPLVSISIDEKCYKKDYNILLVNVVAARTGYPSWSILSANKGD